jgi:N-acetylmuramoyl-L-alanine amidase CwlA
MTFAVDIRHWASADELVVHLAHYSPAIANWAKGIVYHHTAVPTIAQWRGRKTLEGIRDYYRDVKHWPAGPHLFIAPDGIWQLTPLNMPGVHAIGANASMWGIEVVGNYSKVPWSLATRAQALRAGAALLRWRRLPVTGATVKGHRDYNKPTCPGNAVDLDQVRADLSRLV